MNQRFAEVAFQARQRAGLTVEKAAELIGVSSRTVSYYESGRRVTDEIVARMVLSYNAPSLGYYYLSNELETGRLLLPQVIPAGVASKSIRLRVAMDCVRGLQEQLDNICLDDIIDDDERQALDANAGKYMELAAACMGIRIMSASFAANEKDRSVWQQERSFRKKM